MILAEEALKRSLGDQKKLSPPFLSTHSGQIAGDIKSSICEVEAIITSLADDK
jgi:hypothetical protein